MFEPKLSFFITKNVYLFLTINKLFMIIMIENIQDSERKSLAGTREN